MLRDSKAFSGFSVNDLATAKSFYGEILGLAIDESPGMGFSFSFPNGHTIFVYPKEDHQPAAFTVLNFPVENIDKAVDELGSKGITFERYDNMPGAQDDKNILRGLAANMGPDIAWFKDPAGNVLSVLQDK